MAELRSIKIRKVLDSRGNPTVEVEVFSEKGATGRAIAPGGASKGAFEVKDYPKEGIDSGIQKFRDRQIPRLLGSDLLDQSGIDALLHELDGSEDFSSMGGNIAIATSLAAAKAAARSEGMELYRRLAKKNKAVMPYPIGNIIGGGKHAANGTTMQEFLSVSFGKSYSDSAFANVAVHKRTGEMLRKRFPTYPIGLGDEKAWVAALDDMEAAEMLNDAITYTAERLKMKIGPAIDLAASEFYDGGFYNYKKRKLDRDAQIDFISGMAEKFSIKILEDPLEENDFEGFAELTRRIGKKTIIVGDDLFVTNRERLERGIRLKAANGILIKPNQIGTLTDMIETVELAKRSNYETVISHRSGETEDATIAQLAAGLGIRYIKSGTIGGERTAKHNELIRIEEAESA
ncbi:MAG TPA: enolase C-terminal domain-like protein [Candidatus Saccharimonadales bacterium]|nr:enolase C-terminal domain-like protein [Candidatus Saccharimonadales bacterium]